MNNARLLPVMVLAACCVFSAHTMMGMMGTIGKLFHSEPSQKVNKAIPQLLAPGIGKTNECVNRVSEFLKTGAEHAQLLKETLEQTKKDLSAGNDPYHLVDKDSGLLSDLYKWVGFALTLSAIIYPTNANLTSKLSTGFFGLLGFGILTKGFLVGERYKKEQVKRESERLNSNIDLVLEALKNQLEEKNE